MDDLLAGEKFFWRGARNFIVLDPHSRPAHVFRVRRSIGRAAGETLYA
jgi:starch synthase (maltosyl-transferring)